MFKCNFKVTIQRNDINAVTVRLYGTDGGNYKITEAAFFSEEGKIYEPKMLGYPCHKIWLAIWQGDSYADNVLEIPKGFNRKIKLRIIDRSSFSEWRVCIDIKNNTVEWI